LTYNQFIILGRLESNFQQEVFMAQRSRRSGRVIIYLALIIILVLAVVAFMFRDRLFGTTLVQQPPASSTPIVQQEEMVDIVITTQAVPRGATFNSDVLTTIKYPKKDFIPGTFYNNVNDVVGKVAKISIDAKVPLTQSLVVESGTLNAQEIPAGMVAITIPLRNRVSSVSYAPQAGDHVNIIAALTFVDLDTNFQTVLPDKVGQVTAPNAGGTTPVTPPELTAKVTTDSSNTQGNAVLDPTLNQPLYTYPSEPQRPRLVSQTLVQDAIVLGVGDFLLPAQVEKAAAPTPTPGPNEQPTPAPVVQTTIYPDTITLIVAPQDAVTLNYLIYAGAELTLVLRGTGDTQRVQTEAVTLQYLMDQYNIQLPAKLPYGTEPRTDMTVPIAPLQLDPRYSIPTLVP
jgi:Flp pilus assembly protein CpaB